MMMMLLSALGFTPSGVAAGSLAAAWQASIGNVPAGSIFAMLQSIGAAGIKATGATVTRLLSALGFTPSGVVAGSLAAAWQASIGNVVAGSIFAILQSIGAAGLGKSCHPLGVQLLQQGPPRDHLLLLSKGPAIAG